MNSGLMNEKFLNFFWFMLVVMFLLVGVNFGFFFVKFVLKFCMFVFECCKGEKKKYVKLVCVMIRSLI